MVSFFGMKFGAEKKRKEEPKAAAHEWKKIDQNLLGEGQFFGKTTGPRKLVNGSIRSVAMSRPGTAHSMRSHTPYMHNTHNLAASSMFDLSNLSHTRTGSRMSLKPSSSEANLHLSFGNASVSSLAVPALGGMPVSRPGTSGGTKNKAWVNPLDVHFNRPAAPLTPRSPLGQFEIQPEWTNAADAESSSLFGDKPENVASNIMASVTQRELEEKEREERIREAQRQKEAELERLAAIQRQRSPPRTIQQRTPPQGPNGYPSPPRSLRGPPKGPPRNASGPGPRYQGPPDQRPGSRNGPRNGPPPMNGPRGPMDRPMHHRDGPTGDNRQGPRGGPRQGPPTHGPPMRGPPPPHMRPRGPYGPNGLPSPPGSVPPSEDRSQRRPEKPVIQDVQAKRDTLAFDAPRRHSLSMEIEEFEKSLIEATAARDRPDMGRRGSDTSSLYDDPPEDLSPPPHHVMRPPPPFTGSPEARRERSQSPMNRPGLRPGPNGAGSYQGPFAPGPRPVPPMRQATFPLTSPNAKLAEPFYGSPGPMGNGPIAPPTPDSSNWPLSPLAQNRSQSPVTGPGTPRMARNNVPPPLNFDFPATPSRDGGPFTPPLRKLSERGPHPMLDANRPQTAGDENTGLDVRSDSLASRRPNHGLKSPTGIADNFGTGFI